MNRFLGYSHALLGETIFELGRETSGMKSVYEFTQTEPWHKVFSVNQGVIIAYK